MRSWSLTTDETWRVRITRATARRWMGESLWSSMNASASWKAGFHGGWAEVCPARCKCMWRDARAQALAGRRRADNCALAGETDPSRNPLCSTMRLRQCFARVVGALFRLMIRRKKLIERGGRLAEVLSGRGEWRFSLSRAVHAVLGDAG